MEKYILSGSTKIPVLKNGMSLCLDLDSTDIVISYLEFVERLPFLFIIGRFDKKFIPTKKEISDAILYLGKTWFLRAPIVNVLFHDDDEMFQILMSWVNMYNIMCTIVNENIYVFGSWALKMFQVQNFIFHSWMPNDIDIITITGLDEEIIVKLYKLMKFLDFDLILDMRDVEEYNLDTTSSTVVNMKIPTTEFTSGRGEIDRTINCKIDINTYASINEVISTVMCETDISATQILINTREIFITHPKMTLCNMFNYMFMGRTIKDVQFNKVYNRLSKYIYRGLVLNSVYVHDSIDLGKLLRTQKHHDIAEYAEYVERVPSKSL